MINDTGGGVAPACITWGWTRISERLAHVSFKAQPHFRGRDPLLANKTADDSYSILEG